MDLQAEKAVSINHRLWTGQRSVCVFVCMHTSEIRVTQIYRDFRLILRVIIAQRGGAAGQSGSAQLITMYRSQYRCKMTLPITVIDQYVCKRQPYDSYTTIL